MRMLALTLLVSTLAAAKISAESFGPLSPSAKPCEREMPFYQHMLLACVAPRALLLECYDKKWFDPRGEWLAAKAASPVWEFLTGRGIGLGEWPEPYDDSAVRPSFGYVRRTEDHGLSLYDWHWALDFADQAFKQKTKGDTK